MLRKNRRQTFLLQTNTCLALCVFMVYAAFAAYGKTVLFYLIVFAVIMAIGNLFYTSKKD